MVKPIFSAAMSATPYRKDFYAKLVQVAGGVGEAGGYIEAVSGEEGGEMVKGEKGGV